MSPSVIRPSRKRKATAHNETPPTTPSPTKKSPKLTANADETAPNQPGFTFANNLFNPDMHISYKEPSAVHTLEDIGFPAALGVSPIACSEPFPLFSEDAVNIMRNEVLNPVVYDEHAWSSDVASVLYLRGFAPKYGKFIYEAWHNPRVLEIISKIAGVDLVPVFDYDIAQINTSTPAPPNEYHKAAKADGALVGWHRDSFSFVCVVMLSDTRQMVGGETALRMGNGEVKKIRGPSKGCGAIIQGRYIDHQALQTYGGTERITMVCSFRPRSPWIRDDSVLHTVRPISNLADLYGQVLEYQLENAEERIRAMLREVRRGLKTGMIDARSARRFLEHEEVVYKRLAEQIVDEDRVLKGHMAVACEESMKES